MKKCFKCGERKKLSSFYKHKQMADGHLNKCKECAKADVSSNYRANIDHYKAYERGRAVAPHRKEALKNYAATPVGKASHARSNKRWQASNPIKRTANNIVSNALARGALTKPEHCEACGSAPSRLHGHHDDYAYMLRVRWLCPGCHSAWHKEHGAGENG